MGSYFENIVKWEWVGGEVGDATADYNELCLVPNQHSTARDEFPIAEGVWTLSCLLLSTMRHLHCWQLYGGNRGLPTGSAKSHNLQYRGIQTVPFDT